MVDLDIVDLDMVDLEIVLGQFNCHTSQLVIMIGHSLQPDTWFMVGLQQEMTVFQIDLPTVNRKLNSFSIVA